MSEKPLADNPYNAVKIDSNRVIFVLRTPIANVRSAREVCCYFQSLKHRFLFP